MVLVPTAGGMGYSKLGTVTPPPTKTWGAITITMVPAGQYTVTATVSFRNMTTGETVIIYAPTAIVNVP